MAIEKIILAKPRGFCAGVEMAIETVERALSKHGAPLYVFHEIVHNLHVVNDFKQRGVKFRSLTEAIDTETPTGRAMWQMIGVLAELERSLIVERTRAGVKAAQKRGVKFGRKPKLTADRLAHARTLIEQGTTPTEAAKMMGIGRATLYAALQREAQ